MAMPVMADDTPATGDKTTTSQPYVKTQVDLKQGKIPAAGTNSALGESVVMYTANGGGEIGERGIYTGATDYDESEDADKLITASALNTAFTTLPTTDTTTLECANPGTCTLWTIIDQTAYGVSGNGTTTIDLSQLVNTSGTGVCAKRLDGTEYYTYGVECSTPLSNFGDWGVVFPYNDGTVQVSGISACSSVNEGLSVGGIPTNQTGVQNDYEFNMSRAPTNSPYGGQCYCKLTNPSTSAARWVFRSSYYPDSGCASGCAIECAIRVYGYSDFRGAVFGAN